jgi:hypothetical protein
MHFNFTFQRWQEAHESQQCEIRTLDSVKIESREETWVTMHKSMQLHNMNDETFNAYDYHKLIT